MGAKVLDASAICAAVFLEPEGFAVNSRLVGATIVAPSLLA
jgi:hypothetical protein